MVGLTDFRLFDCGGSRRFLHLIDFECVTITFKVGRDFFQNR